SCPGRSRCLGLSAAAGGGSRVLVSGREAAFGQRPLWCFLFERARQILYWLRFGRSQGSPSTATRKFTRRSMPRTAGLSGSSRVWFMRPNPSDSTVARICGLAPMGLFTSVALIVSAPPAVPATSPLRREEPFLIVLATCPSGAWCCRGPFTLALSPGWVCEIVGRVAVALH